MALDDTREAAERNRLWYVAGLRSLRPIGMLSFVRCEGCRRDFEHLKSVEHWAAEWGVDYERLAAICAVIEGREANDDCPF